MRAPPEIAPSPSLALTLQAVDAGRGRRDWGAYRHRGTLTPHHQALTQTSGCSETLPTSNADESLVDSWYPSPPPPRAL